MRNGIDVLFALSEINSMVGFSFFSQVIMEQSLPPEAENE